MNLGPYDNMKKAMTTNNKSQVSTNADMTQS